MKKYVFLTPAIGNFGGSQMFTYNKSLYLEKNGWEVVVVYAAKYENILVDYLRKYEDNYVPELFSFHNPIIPFRKKRQDVIDKVKGMIGCADEIVIESHFLSLAFWGELIAQSAGARHIVNFLEEPVRVFTPNEYRFWEYKLMRWEFMNASEQSLRRVFKGNFQDKYLSFEHRVSFRCSNVLDFSTSDNNILKSADYSIISIGRLDKPYVRPMINEIVTFCSEYKSFTFNVVLIGGSNDGLSEQVIADIFKDYSNIHLYMLGYMYPIPLHLIMECDVAIGSSNAVLVSADLGIPTISIDMTDLYAIGIYNHTTKQLRSRQSEPKEKVSDLLRDILINKNYLKSDLCPKENDLINDDDFSDQILFVNRSKGNIGYYNILGAYSWSEILVARLKYFTIKTVGLRRVERILRVFRKGALK